MKEYWRERPTQPEAPWSEVRSVPDVNVPAAVMATLVAFVVSAIS